MGWGEKEHLLFFLMEVPLSAGLHWQGSPSLHSLPPWKMGKEKQLFLDCGRISSGLVRGWKLFLDPAEETQLTFCL